MTITIIIIAASSNKTSVVILAVNVVVRKRPHFDGGDYNWTRTRYHKLK